MQFAAFAEEAAENMVNVTPVLLRFVGKFFAVFAIVAVIGIVTPALAKKVDALRAKRGGAVREEDPRMKDVKGIYDAQEPTEKSGQPESEPERKD